MKHNKGLDEQEVVKRLNEHLLALEKQADVSTPSLHWFEQKVNEEKRRLKERLVRELMWFIVVAVSIVIVAITLYIQVPFLFVVVQFAAFLMFIPVIWLLDRNRRGRKQVDQQ